MRIFSFAKRRNKTVSNLNEISVFGSSGFIGKRFCDMYPEKAIVIPRNDYRPQSNQIVYFISTTDNYNILEDPYKDINTNLIKLMDVLNNCKDKDIIFNFISSWFVYGDTDLPAKETSYCNPKGFYSITKRCAEQLIISYCRTYNIKYRILRLGNVVGEGDKGASKKKNAIQMLIQKVIKNEDIPLYEGGRCLRDYIYVDDVCRAIRVCMEKAPSGEIVNISSGIPLEILYIINLAIQLSGSRSKIISVGIPEFHKLVQVKNSYLNVDKLKSYGFSPEYNIEQMVNLLVKYYSKDDGR